jgi:hypothetical protein
VSGTAKVDINSVLVGTSEAAAGGGGFLLSDVFLTSGTWTRPTGVDYVDVIAIGGGGGGAAGLAALDNINSTFNNFGARAGAGGSLALVNNIYVGDQADVSIGVGAGGVGAPGGTASKVSGGTARPITFTSGTATAGGASTFGAYVSAGGGGGATSSASGVSGTATSNQYGATFVNASFSGVGETVTKFPFIEAMGTSGNGIDGTLSISGTSPVTMVYLTTGGDGADAYANSGASGSGGGNSRINIYSTGGTTNARGTSTAVGGTGAFGLFGYGSSSGTVLVGTAAPLANTSSPSPSVGSGAPGPGGGAVIVDRYTGASTGQDQYRDAAATAISGSGGDGGAGLVIVSWVG